MNNLVVPQVTLNTPLSSIVSNKRRVSALKSLGVISVKDAFTYYPFRVTKPLKVVSLDEVKLGEEVAFSSTVQSFNIVPMNARRGFRLEVNVTQNQISAQLIYFSKCMRYARWLSSKLRVGETIVVGGMSSAFNGRLQFTHPQILVVANNVDSLENTAENIAEPLLNVTNDVVKSVDEGLQKLSAPRPVYHATSRISSEHIHETIVYALSLIKRSVAEDATEDATEDAAEKDLSLSKIIPDVLPEFVRAKRNLMHRAEAFSELHNPTSTQLFSKALQTLRYEEAFISQITVLKSRNSAKLDSAMKCSESELREKFIKSLPFPLTGGQKQVISEITEDMLSNHPMRRLLQGEVGSGKTVVAVSAMLQAVGSGHQAVLVAPTQVLASQHAQNLRNMIYKAGLSVKIIMVTGGMKLAERRRALASVASGEPSLIVATHAAFSASFKPTNLALVIIDEQHRFGVQQRDALMHAVSDKLESSSPHLLVMTATPIPRSAAMTWFGDLDASYLTELPGGRKPIRTFIVEEKDTNTMSRMFSHIRARIDAGERAYVVCPHIEDEENYENVDSVDSVNSSENSDFEEVNVNSSYDSDSENSVSRKLHTVNGILQRLQALAQFNGVKFAKLTGRDDDETKNATMEKFASGQVQILVATTVIEVGVDVPQASCIVIFDADRFGLAQLHQLRGRVGRGGTNSWAFLISCAEPGSLAQQRLQVVEKSLDGAVIAQKDLQLRNVGDVLGDSQSGGRSSLKLLRVVEDADMIADAREDACETLGKDLSLLSYPELAGAVLDFTRTGVSLISN